MLEKIYKYQITCDSSYMCKSGPVIYETTEKKELPEGWGEDGSPGYGGSREVSHYCPKCWPSIKKNRGW